MRLVHIAFFFCLACSDNPKTFQTVNDAGNDVEGLDTDTADGPDTDTDTDADTDTDTDADGGTDAGCLNSWTTPPAEICSAHDGCYEPNTKCDVVPMWVCPLQGVSLPNVFWADYGEKWLICQEICGEQTCPTDAWNGGCRELLWDERPPFGFDCIEDIK